MRTNKRSDRQPSHHQFRKTVRNDQSGDRERSSDSSRDSVWYRPLVWRIAQRAFPLVILLSLGMGGVLEGKAAIASTAGKMAMPEETVVSGQPFHRIEQPIGAKVGVTLGGFGLIALEMWWFVFSRHRPSPSQKPESSVTRSK